MATVKASSLQWWGIRSADDSLIDRLNRAWAAGVLCLFGLVLYMIFILGNPLDCWCPAHFTESHRSYTNKVCWPQQSYYEVMEESLPYDVPIPKVAYYRWVPLIILCQGLLFLLPYLFWRVLAPMKVTSTLRSAWRGHISCCESERLAILRYLSNNLCNYLSRSEGTYHQVPFLSVLYILTKVFYIIICCAQLVFLDWFLEWDRYPYGIQLIVDLANGTTWGTSPVLPRTILCNFEIRDIQTVHDYVVQCAVQTNALSEWVFILVWFWITLLLCLNIYSLCFWFIAYISKPGRMSFLTRLICSGGKSSRKGQNRASALSQAGHMSADISLILALMTHNTDEAFASEVLMMMLDSSGVSAYDLASAEERECLQPSAPQNDENITWHPSVDMPAAVCGVEKKARVAY